LSQDEGITWTKEGNLDLGRIVVGPEIIRLDDGSYKLFFTMFDAHFGVGKQYGMSASSQDGVSFVVDKGKCLEPYFEKNSILNPDVVRLSDGRYRMYFSEMQQDAAIEILSAVSN
jgi:hypothetical protein